AQVAAANPAVNAGFVGQPAAMANPAFVPGQQDAEAAWRYAAVNGQPSPLLPTEIWLVLAVGAVGGVLTVTQLRRRGRPALAWAGH
ncbi:MAG TPA: hypothetical protein VGV67_00675, partial [Solirubrobacteraceae bacterium]|nr:hypothetical protein [Solirubrobacteraceae bacterium]